MNAAKRLRSAYARNGLKASSLKHFATLAKNDPSNPLCGAATMWLKNKATKPPRRALVVKAPKAAPVIKPASDGSKKGKGK